MSIQTARIGRVAAAARHRTGGGGGGTNIAIMPDFWDSAWLSWNDGYCTFPTPWQGYASCINMGPDPTSIADQQAHGWTGENEINGLLCYSGGPTCTQANRTERVPVSPGSHVVYGAWAWVTPTTVGQSYGGGFQLYADAYADGGRIKELDGTLALDGDPRLNVPYGSTAWTYVEMSFTVAATYTADGALGYPSGTQVVPSSIIPILTLNNWDPVNGYYELATAYIRDTVLYVT